MNYELAVQAREILRDLDLAEALIPESSIPESLELTMSPKEIQRFDNLFSKTLREFIAQRKAELEAL